VSFARPELLLLALIAAPEILFAVLRTPRLRSTVEALAGPARRARAGAAFAALSAAGAAAGALFIVSAAVALAGPSWGRRGAVAERSGLEAAFVIDASRSMEAADSGGTRLDAAKAIARAAVRGEGHAGRRASFSIVAAKGDAVLLAPMTEDAAALEDALDYAGPDAITTVGTDLERGIEAGLASFTASGAGDRVLVLLSDGGELSGSARRAAERAQLSRARMIVVGIGGAESAPVPGPDGSPMVDERGARVASALDAEGLRAIAAAAGGRYLEASDSGARAALEAELAAAAAGGTRIEYVTADRAGDFALAALAFLVAAVLAGALSTRGAAA
jgi:Ca-activated chloride channel homolog